MSHQLTKHSVGSVRELWSLAFPMIIALLSGNLMLFFDRLFLASYSTAAMNAAAAAGMVVAIGQFGLATVAAIAEVFVGQFHGAKEYDRAAAPAWQMIWFGASTLLLFIPLALFGGPYLLPDYHYADFGLPYFQWLLFFAAFTPTVVAVQAFFIGIGNTKLVMGVTIAGNLMNVLLDPLLIFGFGDLVPAYGTKGAAIATGLSEVAQLLILLGVFLSRHYRQKYGSSRCALDLTLLMRCLKVGVPSSVAHIFEWSAWAVVTRLMAELSELHLTVAAVGQSFYMLITFGFEGLQKAITTLAANQIGASCSENIWKVWRAGVKLLLLFAIPFGLGLLFYPDPLIRLFLSGEQESAEVIMILRVTCVGVWVYYLLDGLTWISVGVLTAAKDTQYVMWVNGVTAWLCGLIPVTVLMIYFAISPAFYFAIICFYGLCNALAFSMRLQKEPWKRELAAA